MNARVSGLPAVWKAAAETLAAVLAFASTPRAARFSDQQNQQPRRRGDVGNTRVLMAILRSRRSIVAVIPRNSGHRLTRKPRLTHHVPAYLVLELSRRFQSHLHKRKPSGGGSNEYA